jgi:hypothetical protein
MFRGPKPASKPEEVSRAPAAKSLPFPAHLTISWQDFTYILDIRRKFFEQAACSKPNLRPALAATQRRVAAIANRPLQPRAQ